MPPGYEPEARSFDHFELLHATGYRREAGVWQGPSGLTLARLDGSEQMQLFIDDTVHRGHADWSPDGAMLAYVRDEADGSADIRVINRDGNDDRLLGTSTRIDPPDAVIVSASPGPGQRI